MATLYAEAQSYGLLVAGTGNKVEDFGVGFFTKYGDGGVDLSPIAGLYKSQVYRVGEHLGVPKNILEAAPTLRQRIRLPAQKPRPNADLQCYGRCPLRADTFGWRTAA